MAHDDAAGAPTTSAPLPLGFACCQRRDSCPGRRAARKHFCLGVLYIVLHGSVLQLSARGNYGPNDGRNWLGISSARNSVASVQPEADESVCARTICGDSSNANWPHAAITSCPRE